MDLLTKHWHLFIYVVLLTLTPFALVILTGLWVD